MNCNLVMSSNLNDKHFTISKATKFVESYLVFCIFCNKKLIIMKAQSWL